MIAASKLAIIAQMPDPGSIKEIIRHRAFKGKTPGNQPRVNAL